MPLSKQAVIVRCRQGMWQDMAENGRYQLVFVSYLQLLGRLAGLPDRRTVACQRMKYEHMSCIG